MAGLPSSHMEDECTDKTREALPSVQLRTGLEIRDLKKAGTSSPKTRNAYLRKTKESAHLCTDLVLKYFK